MLFLRVAESLFTSSTRPDFSRLTKNLVDGVGIAEGTPPDQVLPPSCETHSASLPTPLVRESISRLPSLRSRIMDSSKVSVPMRLPALQARNVFPQSQVS